MNVLNHDAESSPKLVFHLPQRLLISFTWNVCCCPCSSFGCVPISCALQTLSKIHFRLLYYVYLCKKTHQSHFVFFLTRALKVSHQVIVSFITLIDPLPACDSRKTLTLPRLWQKYIFKFSLSSSGREDFHKRESARCRHGAKYSVSRRVQSTWKERRFRRESLNVVFLFANIPANVPSLWQAAVADVCSKCNERGFSSAGSIGRLSRPFTPFPALYPSEHLSSLAAIRDLTAAAHKQKENVLSDGPYEPERGGVSVSALSKEKLRCYHLIKDWQYFIFILFFMCLINVCESNHCKCKFCNNYDFFILYKLEW